MVTKPFEQDVYNFSDAFGKNTVIKYIKKAHPDWTVQENPDKYKIDLIIKENENIKFLVEVEHRPIWGNGKFPYHTVHVPFRKKKFVTLDFPIMYCIVNKDGTQMLVIGKEKFINNTPIEVPNAKVPVGEYFYDISIESSMYRDI
jgi:hypothetical protein